MIKHDNIIDIIKNLQKTLISKYDECVFLPSETDNEYIEGEMVEIIKKCSRR